MKRRIAIGPELPEFGSWNWVGKDLMKGLEPQWSTTSFANVSAPPPADVTIYLKFLPSRERLAELQQKTRLVFMPIDVYGSSVEIESDRHRLRMFDLILVHSQRLIRYLNSAAQTRYVDHALRFTTPAIVTPNPDGPLLWVGRRCNIDPVVAWCNRFDLGRPVNILTEGRREELTPTALGFSNRNQICVDPWSEDRHIERIRTASVALDIKGDDFRSRHKPPAKALDFVASGLPLIVNRGGSADLHLSTLGLTPEPVSEKDVHLVRYSSSPELVKRLSRELRLSAVTGRTLQLLQELLN